MTEDDEGPPEFVNDDFDDSMDDVDAERRSDDTRWFTSNAKDGWKCGVWSELLRLLLFILDSNWNDAFRSTVTSGFVTRRMLMDAVDEWSDEGPHVDAKLGSKDAEEIVEPVGEIVIGSS
ncbi:hypothetical protein FI667_g3466, partial [Globisporangium splendens]